MFENLGVVFVDGKITSLSSSNIEDIQEEIKNVRELRQEKIYYIADLITEIQNDI